jgi:hypothetical protein
LFPFYEKKDSGCPFIFPYMRYSHLLFSKILWLLFFLFLETYSEFEIDIVLRMVHTCENVAAIIVSNSRCISGPYFSKSTCINTIHYHPFDLMLIHFCITKEGEYVYIICFFFSNMSFMLIYRDSDIHLLLAFWSNNSLYFIRVEIFRS